MFIEITGDSEIIGVYDPSSPSLGACLMPKMHGHQHAQPWRYDVPGVQPNHDDEGEHFSGAPTTT